MTPPPDVLCVHRTPPDITGHLTGHIRRTFFCVHRTAPDTSAGLLLGHVTVDHVIAEILDLYGMNFTVDRNGNIFTWLKFYSHARD
jgi:hypothetical protein